MRGKSPASLAITVDSEPGTIRYLGHQILKELESKNITVLAMCFGYRGIDIIKTPDDTLVKSILGINQDQNIVFEVKFKACNVHFVPCLYDLKIPCGGRVPSSLAITADSETQQLQLESKNITFLAMPFGYRQIDVIKTPDMLLKNILGINQHPTIVFEGKHGAKDLTPPQGCHPRKIHLTLAVISTGTTERNAGTLAAGLVIFTGIIKAVGFQAAGVLVGSPAAAWMASIGAVQVGSLAVLLQSMGAVGLGPLGIVLSGAGWGLFKSFIGQC
ncbi:hypothetical protein PSHT_02649, partial [Puccinia striiformis]